MNKIVDTDSMQSLGSLTDKIIKNLSKERIYDGKTIDQPGILKGVPMSVYHSDCCAGPSISSSGLREIAPPDGCPLKFWDNSYMNPDRAEQGEKDHFSLGRAVHTLLLGEDGFKNEFVIRPLEFPDYKTKAAREWRDNQVKAGKSVLKPEALEQIEGMANRVANDRDFLDHLQGRVERTIVYQDKKTGIWVKSRPDSIPADTIIADLKTTADASERGCLNAIKNYNYHMQMALAGTALEIVTGQRIMDHVLLFIEPKRPFAYNIKPIDNQYIWIGARQNRAALDIFADCWERKHWPTYYGSGLTASPSDYFEKQIENEPSIPAEAA
ncbi:MULTISPECIES: PD-(D/E)XK nuclease-like domain-containing protein [unclassified Phyllobacterium]|uniref:PD-(D/E)XK nuclease-like domain-containing protein n=1 Tax=unclassified Phyllobacterium TaxID=2638441 RepID=UPI003012F173